MKLKRNRKLVSILLTLSFLVCMLVPMVGPAAASSTYTTLSVPTVLNDDSRQNLGTLQIDIPQTTAGTSTILVTMPTDVTINWTDNTVVGGVYSKTPAVTVGKVGGGVFTAADIAAGNAMGTAGGHYWNDGIVYVSDREFKITYNAAATAYDVRLLVTLPSMVVPSSADGDITVAIEKLAGDFSGGNVVVAKAGSGSVSTYVNSTVTFTNSGTAAGAVEIYLKENTANALKKSNTIPTAKFKLPKGMTWSGPAVANLTTGAATTVTARVATGDARVLEVIKPAANADPKSIYKISGTIVVDDSEAVLGAVEVSVSGASSISPGTLTIGDYVDYGITVVAAEDVKTVKAGRLGEEVADFNIEENAKGSILNGRSITMELPEGVKWGSLTASQTGSIGGQGTITAVGSNGRKIKFTATNTATPSKGKFKFENVELDIAVDFTGDIKVKVDGAGIDKQEVLVGTVPEILTATATTPEVKIGMQGQVGGTIKIVEAVKEALINGKDLKVVAPSGVKWAKIPTVEVIEGDLSISSDVTKSGNTLIIPIKSQSTKASTIEISNVEFTIDRTVPEGYITLDVLGDAIDEANDSTENGGAAFNRGYYTINSDGYAFAGRDVAVSVDAAKTITPAPDAEKSTAVFTIGSATFTMNGVEQTMDAAPYIKNDRTYLPIRFVAKAVGVAENNIIWNAAEQTVVLIKGDRVVKLVIGSNNMLINGVAMTMDVAPEIVDPGRTMLPVRWVGQALGADIDWDAATQTVTVN